MKSIHFFAEEISFDLENQQVIIDWLSSICAEHQFGIQEINYIFCSDDYLLNINQEYLNHDYYTDIITFNNSEEEKELEADIFISIDRVKENAHSGNQPFSEELHRVMVHGVLHLLGYDDKSIDQQEEMRRKEDTCLSLLDF